MPNIKGTWEWGDNPQVNVPSTIDQNVNFTSNGENFERIEIRGFIRYYYAGEHDPEYIDVTATGTWTKSDYKYLDFGATDQTVDDDFYSFIEENAAPYMSVQIGAVYPVTLLTRDKYVDKNIRVLPPPADEPVLEEKTVTPNDEIQVIEPSQGYDALSKVTVNAVPTEEKTATPTEQQQLIEPSEGQYLSSVTVEAIEATEKSVTENGEYTPDTGTYYKKVNVNVPQYTDISSTTAQADDVLEGEYFFPYNGAPRTEGTIPVRTASNPEFTSKNDSVTFQKGYYPEASTVKIAESEKEKIIPDNIKEGISILGVQGNYAGNGLDINGAINEYVVNAGANVNAGDFVEFITNNTDYFSGNSGLTCACLIDDNKVLVAYYNDTLKTIQSCIININENGVTIGAVYTVETSYQISCLSACTIETDKVFLAYGTTSPLYYGYAKVLQINNEIITAGARTQFHNSMVEFICLFHAENTNQVLIAYSRRQSTDSARVRVATINDLSITLSDYYGLGTNILFMGMCKVTANAACLIYIVASDTIYARIVSIKNGNLSVGASKTTTGAVFVSSPCLLNSTTVLFLWAPNVKQSVKACFFGKIALSDTSSDISVSSVSTYSSVLFAFGQYNLFAQPPELRQLENGKLLLTYVDGGQSLKTKIINDNSLDSQNANCTIYNDFSSYLAPVVLSSTKAIIFYCSDTKTHDFSIIDINGNNITRSRTQNPTYVQPATTRDNYVGVAKTGGTSGQTVEVYEVPFSYTVTVTKTNCTNTAVTSPMKQSETQTITFTANTAYELPETITVTNCEYTWNNLTGELTITNLTGNVQITVNATVQKLAAPVIALNGSVISWSAVANATSYGIFADNKPFGASTTGTSFDLSDYEKAIGAGTKNITVNAQGSPYAPSDASNAVSYTVIALSAPTLTWTAASGLLTWTASENAESYTVYEQISASDWNEVTTTTATYASIDFDAGAHTMAVKATSTTKVDSALSNAVTVNVYGISTTLTGVTGASGNASKIYEGTSETLTFTANDGYTLPETITVTNAQYTWNNGTLTLSNPTGNVTVTITGVQEQTGYTVTVYNMYEENRTTSVTINGHTIQPGQNYTFTNIAELTFGEENGGLDVSVKMNSTTASWGGDYQWTSFPQSITIEHDCNVATWVEVF